MFLSGIPFVSNNNTCFLLDTTILTVLDIRAVVTLDSMGILRCKSLASLAWWSTS